MKCLKKCCWSLDLASGCIALAIGWIIVSILMIVDATISLIMNEAILVGSIIAELVSILIIAMSILLIFGVSKSKEYFLLPFIFVMSTLLVAYIIVLPLYLISDESIFEITTSVLLGCWMGYSVLVVYSFYLQLHHPED